MATSKVLTVKADSGSPYQLNAEQVLKASTALLKHMRSAVKEVSTLKPNLLADDDQDGDDESTPIWLNLTTKKHIIDEKRLKPAKIAVPHPLNTSNSTTICLITSSPQRQYKDLIASPAFPPELGSRITRVIDITKLKAKFSQYEAQRKLRSEHDIFLADDRIITLLSRVLGKTFYKTAAYRPIPVDIAAPSSKTAEPKSNIKRSTDGQGAVSSHNTPQAIASEIEKAVRSALVNLSPSTSTAVKVGYASWEPQKVAENVEVVAKQLIEKFVPKKWRGVKSIHIKGPETTALPIWLADELWTDDADILEPGAVVEANVGKKRKAKAIEGPAAATAALDRSGKDKKAKKAKLLESNDDNLDREIALRKERLQKQKEEVTRDVDGDANGALTAVLKKVKQAKSSSKVKSSSS